MHDKHKARKRGKKARECKSISKECTTFAMPKILQQPPQAVVKPYICPFVWWW